MSRNKQIAQAFKSVKPHLQTAEESQRDNFEKHEFICNALEKVSQLGVQVDAATDLIQQRIAPHRTLNAWVVHNVLGGDWNLCGRPAMQDYRHRWVDELIREFSAKK